MTILIVLKYLGVAFAGGVLTSLAEKIFKYSLFDTIAGAVKKLFGGKKNEGEKV